MLEIVILSSILLSAPSPDNLLTVEGNILTPTEVFHRGSGRVEGKVNK